ncbi:MAG TPA: 4-hydroxy-tetrahydrodipicolinate synthase [Gaiellaceae bacterium]
MLGEVITAIVTPFHADGSVDVDAFRRLANHLVDNGSDGLVVAGTTGEGPTLSDEEKLELFAAALDAVGDRATVVANTGTYDTQHSAHLTGEAHDLGVHGILVVTPYYNKPPQRAIVRHFQEIACMTDKPVLAYNIPSRVVVNIEPATMDELAQIENVAGVKQAHDDIDEARQIVDLGLTLYAGDDNLVLPFLEVGGEGGVCVHTHVWGPQTKEMIRRYKSGDVAAAQALNDEMAPAFELLRIQTNPIPIKAAVNLLGHEVGGYRLPMVDPTEDELTQVRSCLERAGMLEAARA